MSAAWAVQPASATTTPAALALLAESQPELARPLCPAPLLWVAQGSDGRVVGAIAAWPRPALGGAWGCRAHAAVRPAWQRQGIARALVQAAGAQLATWGVPRLISWAALPEAGPGSAFARVLGGQVGFSLHHYLTDWRAPLARCQRLVARLGPTGFTLVPLADGPRAPLLALHCGEFHAQLRAAEALFDAALADPRTATLSFALLSDGRFAGYLLAGAAGGLPRVDFWACTPAHRSGAAAALLLNAFVHTVVAQGGTQARYHCNAAARSPMNFARRSGARLEGVDHGWCLALPAPPAPPAPPLQATTGPRTVLIEFAGLHRVAGLQGLAGPHLAHLLAQPAATLPPLALQVSAGSLWAAPGFDDPGQLCPDFWALDPALASHPALARAARVSPLAITQAQLGELRLPAATTPGTAPASAALLAHWASIHNLGVHAASQPDGAWALLALRFDGLPEWLAQARLRPADAQTATRAWLACFDLLLGRYRQLLGEQVRWAVREATQL